LRVVRDLVERLRDEITDRGRQAEATGSGGALPNESHVSTEVAAADEDPLVRVGCVTTECFGGAVWIDADHTSVWDDGIAGTAVQWAAVLLCGHGSRSPLAGSATGGASTGGQQRQAREVRPTGVRNAALEDFFELLGFGVAPFDPSGGDGLAG
jgi:hypothetical protein